MHAARIILAAGIGLAGIAWGIVELITGNPATAIVGLVLIELVAAIIQPSEL